MIPHPLCIACPRREHCCRIRGAHDTPPCPEILQKTEGIEDDPNLCGFKPEVLVEYLLELLPGMRHGYGEPPPPAKRTKAPAGSDEKIAVMRARAARGEGIFHAGDPQYQSPEQEVREDARETGKRG